MLCDALLKVARKSEECAELVRSAPHKTLVRRLGHARAAWNAIVRGKKALSA